MGATPIEWTDFSINPLRARLRDRVGHYCEKVSPGCKNCYSSRLQPRFGLPQFQEQRGNADVKSFLDETKLHEVLRRRKPTKFFWCDMTDMFGEWVPDEAIAMCFAAMAATTWHTHQVLTKRADRLREIVPKLYANDGAMLIEAAERLAPQIDACHIGEDDWKFPLPNVWLGVSAEDQARADERIPDLLATPAAVRFVSAEPLLGRVNLERVLWTQCERCGGSCSVPVPGGGRPCPACLEHQGFQRGGLDWVIVGGESGQQARQCDIAWIRSLVEQCRSAGVAAFVKQLGAKPVPLKPMRLPSWNASTGKPHRGWIDDTHHALSDSKGGEITEWPEDLRVREFPEAHP
jgi:protein gp37